MCERLKCLYEYWRGLSSLACKNLNLSLLFGYILNEEPIWLYSKSFSASILTPCLTNYFVICKVCFFSLKVEAIAARTVFWWPPFCELSHSSLTRKKIESYILLYLYPILYLYFNEAGCIYPTWRVVIFTLFVFEKYILWFLRYIYLFCKPTFNTFLSFFVLFKVWFWTRSHTTTKQGTRNRRELLKVRRTVACTTKWQSSKPCRVSTRWFPDRLRSSRMRSLHISRNSYQGNNDLDVNTWVRGSSLTSLVQQKKNKAFCSFLPNSIVYWLTIYQISTVEFIFYLWGIALLRTFQTSSWANQNISIISFFTWNASFNMVLTNRGKRLSR